MARWDWYEATAHGVEAEDIAAAVQKHVPDFTDVEQVTPKYGYVHGLRLLDSDKETLCQIWWGGNPGTHFVATGEKAPLLCEAVKEKGISHRVTRADSCVDWVGDPDRFDRIARHLLDFATENGRLRISQVGNWEQGKERTLYIGSKKSPVMIRLYEKGHQMGTDPTWVRLEVVVRPKGDRGYEVAQWEPSQAFGASAWLVTALERLGWDDLQKESIGTVWRPSNAQRARMALVKQYGSTLQEWVDEIGGWENLPDAIAETAELAQKAKGHATA